MHITKLDIKRAQDFTALCKQYIDITPDFFAIQNNIQSNVCAYIHQSKVLLDLYKETAADMPAYNIRCKYAREGVFNVQFTRQLLRSIEQTQQLTQQEKKKAKQILTLFCTVYQKCIKMCSYWHKTYNLKYHVPCTIHTCETNVVRLQLSDKSMQFYINNDSYCPTFKPTILLEVLLSNIKLYHKVMFLLRRAFVKKETKLKVFQAQYQAFTNLIIKRR